LFDDELRIVIRQFRNGSDAERDVVIFFMAGATGLAVAVEGFVEKQISAAINELGVQIREEVTRSDFNRGSGTY
jgi:hypothetical protein